MSRVKNSAGVGAHLEMRERSVRDFVSRTFFTGQGLPQVVCPALGAGHPRSYLPGRVMTHMLGMATFQVGHPVVVFVLMKTDNRLFDRHS